MVLGIENNKSKALKKIQEKYEYFGLFMGTFPIDWPYLYVRDVSKWM